MGPTCERHHGADTPSPLARGGHLQKHMAARVCGCQKGQPGRPAGGILRTHRTRRGRGVPVLRAKSEITSFWASTSTGSWSIVLKCRSGQTAEEVLNRALLYRDRRDFVIKPGDTGTRKGGPAMANSKDGFEQLDVRTKWKDEARDFTPWLAENIECTGR